jgi:predicted O-methyltransferase YrrM
MNYWLNRIPYLIKENLLLTVIASHLKHRDRKPFRKILPVVSIEEIAGTPIPEIINNEFEDGNISGYELECICKIVKKFNPAAIFEIGTFNGRTSLNMAANTSEETKIYTLDLPPDEISKTRLRIKSGEKKFIDKEISGIRFSGTRYEKKITQIYADSAKYDYSRFINAMDLVFIDGSHSYEYVVNDTNIALQLLRNGKGIIIWHDYGWNEVIQALNEFYLEDRRFLNIKNIAGTSIAFIQFG